MCGSDYWLSMYRIGMYGMDYTAGVKAGIQAYAHWKDGIQYVGTTGKTLKDALEEVDEAFAASRGLYKSDTGEQDGRNREIPKSL